jgi:hypothetical protein
MTKSVRHEPTIQDLSLSLLEGGCDGGAERDLLFCGGWDMHIDGYENRSAKG